MKMLSQPASSPELNPIYKLCDALQHNSWRCDQRLEPAAYSGPSLEMCQHLIAAHSEELHEASSRGACNQ